MLYFILLFNYITNTLIATITDTTNLQTDSLCHSFEIQDLEKYPIQSIRDVLLLQPGVIDCRGDLHIRGGFAENIEYWIDGVPLYIPNLPVGFINKISFNGNPTSGRYGRPNVVEIEIKERVKSGGWLTGFDEGMSTYELSASGIYNDKLKYSFMGYTKSRDYERSYLFDLSNTDSDLYYLLGSMKYEVSPNINIGLGFIAVRGQGGLYSTFLGLPWFLPSENSEKYKPDWLRSSWLEKGKQLYAFFQHRINDKISYSARLVNFNQYKIIGERDLNFDEERRFYEDIKFEPWWMYTYHRYTTAQGTGWDERDENGEYIYPYGVPACFLFGSPSFWYEMERSVSLINIDFDARLSDWLKFNTGIEFKGITILNKLTDHISSMPTVDSVTPNGDTIPVVDPELRDISIYLYWDYIKKNPIQNSLWFDFTAHNAGVALIWGVRVVYYNPGTWKFVVDYPSSDTLQIESTWEISPKFSITYNPADRFKILLGYNQYYMNESYIKDYHPFAHYSYNFSLFNYTEREGAIILLSQVKSFKLQGLFNIKSNFMLSLIAFLKNVYGSYNSPYPPWTYYSSLEREGYGASRGIEVVFRYSLPDLSLYLNYTLQDSKWKFRLYGREELYPSDWDQRHSINAFLSKDIHNEWKLANIKPLDNINISIILEAKSELTYTKRTDNGRIVDGYNEERMNWIYNTDLKLTKNIYLGGLNFSLFVEIDNLFNTKNIINVYPNTGKPDDNGLMYDREYYLSLTFPSHYEEDDGIPVGVLLDGSADERRDFDGNGYISRNEWYESYVRAYTDYMRDPFNYGPPRKISVGIQIVW